MQTDSLPTLVSTIAHLHMGLFDADLDRLRIEIDRREKSLEAMVFASLKTGSRVRIKGTCRPLRYANRTGTIKEFRRSRVLVALDGMGTLTVPAGLLLPLEESDHV